ICRRRRSTTAVKSDTRQADRPLPADGHETTRWTDSGLVLLSTGQGGDEVAGCCQLPSYVGVQVLAKCPVEIMEILASFDLTRCAWSAAQLSGCDPKTVQHYVELRDAGHDPLRRARRPRLIDPWLEKIEELVERSRGKVRADVVHMRLRATGF